MSRAAYDAIKALNWSRLKLIGRSPAHFKNGYGEESSGFDLGTAAHAAVLEPDRFAAEFVVYPGPVRRGKAWEQFESDAIADGKTVLSRSEHEKATQIAAAVRRHARASELLSGGASEVALTWDLAGIACKGRADYIGSALVDLKSTQNASLKDFGWSCVKYGYLGQAAWYSDGLFKATGRRLPFYFVAVESSAPYIVTVFHVGEHLIERGREQYLTYLAKLDECQRSGDWHGYVREPEIELEIPQEAVNV